MSGGPAGPLSSIVCALAISDGRTWFTPPTHEEYLWANFFIIVIASVGIGQELNIVPEEIRLGWWEGIGEAFQAKKILWGQPKDNFRVLRQ